MPVARPGLPGRLPILLLLAAILAGCSEEVAAPRALGWLPPEEALRAAGFRQDW